MANTTNYYFNLPVIGGSQNSWGTDLNENWSKIDSLLYGASYTDSDTNTVEKIQPDLDEGNWAINGAAVTATASDLNKIDGYNGNTNDLNILSGAAAAGVTSASFVHLNGVSSNLQTQINSVIPSGVILLWSGSVSNIPTGWVLCDGTNNTPDLQNRFVVGAGDTYSVDGTGGSSTTTLISDNLPSHTHTYSGTTDNTSLTGSINKISETFASNGGTATGVFTKGSATATGTPSSPDSGSVGSVTMDASHTHTYSGTTDATGSGTAFDNKPPYYALAYIMKT